MGLFSLPKCPHCGGKTERTHASFPFPQLRCPNCIKNNMEKKQLNDRITALEKKLANP